MAGADGSSVLLGDVAALPRDLQARLAEALEPGEGRVRLLAVTTADPEAAVRDAVLREDLFLALSVLTIPLAPLRERREEIPLLAQALLERINRRGGPQRAGFAPAAADVLAAYHWPGNLREMGRVVEFAHGRGPAPLIAPDDLPADVRGHLADAYPPPKPAPPRPLDDIIRQGKELYARLAPTNETPYFTQEWLQNWQKRRRLFIFTGRTRDEYESIWGERLNPYFTEVLCLGEHGFPGKPAPDGLHYLIQKHALQGGLYIGNSVDDMRAAEAAGLQAVGITTNQSEETLRKAGADHIIHRLDQLT